MAKNVVILMDGLSAVLCLSRPDNIWRVYPCPLCLPPPVGKRRCERKRPWDTLFYHLLLCRACCRHPFCDVEDRMLSRLSCQCLVYLLPVVLFPCQDRYRQVVFAWRDGT